MLRAAPNAAEGGRKRRLPMVHLRAAVLSLSICVSCRMRSGTPPHCVKTRSSHRQARLCDETVCKGADWRQREHISHDRKVAQEA
mmetsp:Transcript_21827/g.60802  ORF Transcript_21827/g.60802 Transcript_21827/m.60802 type:complete len:85 (+) Transcript_21827:416-670(+)